MKKIQADQTTTPQTTRLALKNLIVKSAPAALTVEEMASHLAAHRPRYPHLSFHPFNGNSFY